MSKQKKEYIGELMADMQSYQIDSLKSTKQESWNLGKWAEYYNNQHSRIYKDFEFSYNNIKKYIDIWRVDAEVMEAMEVNEIVNNYSDGNISHYSYLESKYKEFASMMETLSKNFYSQAELIADMGKELGGINAQVNEIQRQLKEEEHKKIQRQLKEKKEGRNNDKSK